MKHQYIGLIMDGNRRWAKQNNQDHHTTYEKGVINCKKILLACIAHNILEASFYALSLDNYKSRSSFDINILLSFCTSLFYENIDFFMSHHITIKFIGYLAILPTQVQKIIYEIEKKTSLQNNKLIAYILFCYDPVEDISNKKTSQKLQYSNEIHSIDLIIRTGGHNRLSGFLPMQSMYANIISVETLWPDFTETQFTACIQKKFINNYGS